MIFVESAFWGLSYPATPNKLGNSVVPMDVWLFENDQRICSDDSGMVRIWDLNAAKAKQEVSQMSSSPSIISVRAKHKIN